jgi:hypothetical protein
MKTRREVLSGIAVISAVSAAPKASAHPDNVMALLCQLEVALYKEVPGIKKFQVSFDPKDKKVPLSVCAFRI